MKIETPKDWEVREIPCSQIRLYADNPRKTFDYDALKELADSIKIDGLQQPITVRWTPEANPACPYTLIMGERRLRATQMAELRSIRAVIRVGITDQQHLLLATMENMQRRDLTSIEEARAFQKLVEAGIEQKEIAERVGRSAPYISNAIRLLGLPQSVLSMIENGDLSPGHGRTLLPMAAFPPVVEKMAEFIITHQWTVRNCEQTQVPGHYELERQGLIKSLGYEATFDKTECQNCPYGARFGSNYGAYCFKPEHWKEKAEAAKAVQKADVLDVAERAKATTAAILQAAKENPDATLVAGPKGKITAASANAPHSPVPESGEDIADESRKVVQVTIGDQKVTMELKVFNKLPKVSDFEYNQREYIHRNDIKGCDSTCPCRVLAREGESFQCSEICVDLNRRRGLKAQQNRAKNKTRKERFDDIWLSISEKLEQDSTAYGRLAALVLKRSLPSYVDPETLLTASQHVFSDPLRTVLKRISSRYDKPEAGDAELLKDVSPRDLIDAILLVYLAKELSDGITQKSDTLPLCSFFLNEPDCGNPDREISREKGGQ